MFKELPKKLSYTKRVKMEAAVAARAGREQLLRDRRAQRGIPAAPTPMQQMMAEYAAYAPRPGVVYMTGPRFGQQLASARKAA